MCCMDLRRKMSKRIKGLTPAQQQEGFATIVDAVVFLINHELQVRHVERAIIVTRDDIVYSLKALKAPKGEYEDYLPQILAIYREEGWTVHYQRYGPARKPPYFTFARGR